MDTDRIADLFGISRELGRRWEREGLEKRLHAALWRAKVTKHILAIEDEMARELIGHDPSNSQSGSTASSR